MASEITTDGCWRVTYGEKLGLTHEELLACQPWKYTDIINPISSANLVRLHSTDPETVIDTDPFFRMVKEAETDVQYARQLADVSTTWTPLSSARC
jgi:hypothetical protein